MQLKGKVALITGGGVRIGRAIALALATAGCDVFIHYHQSNLEAEEARAEAESLGVRARTYSANLADSSLAETVITKALEAFDRIDILINNASIIPKKDNFSQIDLPLWDQIFALNLRAPFQLSQAFAKQIPSQGQGRIININDCNIPHPNTSNFAYRLSKRGLWDMTSIMALELAPRITVNALALGMILPQQTCSSPEKFVKDYTEQKIPLKIPGNPEIVAESLLFLLRQDFMTGTTIRLDGGEGI